MSVENLLRAPLAFLTLCGALLTVACGEGESVSAEGCLLSPAVDFHGREYTESDEVNGLSERQIKRGRPLGVGELPSYCGDSEGDRVQIFKVVGVSVKRGVYADPPFGLVVRSHLDRE
jgi:hypothetical protein